MLIIVLPDFVSDRHDLVHSIQCADHVALLSRYRRDLKKALKALKESPKAII